jgi:hypothetical protein
MDDTSASSNMAALSKVVAQEEVVTQEEIPQIIGEAMIIDDTPKLVTIANKSPTKATDGLVDILWKGAPLKNLAFESLAKQQQLVNTIRQLERIEAVKTRFIYVSTFLTNIKVRTSKTPS